MLQNSPSIGYVNLSDYDTKDLVMYHSNSAQCEPGHYWSGIRDHFLIHYVLSGKGIFVVNNTTYHLRRGQGFLICPDILSFYQADMDEPWEYCWVGFHGRYAKEYLSKVNLEVSHPIFTSNLDSSPEKTIYKMMEVQNKTTGKDFILTSLLYRFFAELANMVECSSRYASNGENIKQIYVQEAIDYIHKNYSRKLYIEQISNYIGIDRKYMSALFQEILHTTPQKFLLNFRIDKACVLLSQNLLSIKNVAHSVGYDDPLLFSKMFKKHKGLSPIQYSSGLLDKIKTV